MSNYTVTVLGLGATDLPMAARLAKMGIVATNGLLSSAVNSRAGIDSTISSSTLTGDVRV